MRPDAQSDAGECVLLADEPGFLCNEELCEETHIFLCTNPAEHEQAGLACEFQPGLLMDGKPVWACGKLGLV